MSLPSSKTRSVSAGSVRAANSSCAHAPFGDLVLDARDLDDYRDDFDTKALLKEQTTADNLDDKRMTFLMLFMQGKKNSKLNETFLWNQQYKGNRLDTLMDTRRLGSDSSTEDDMRTSVRQALDLAVCLSFAAAREGEKQLGASAAREELLSALLNAEVRGTSAAPGTGEPLLDVRRAHTAHECLHLAGLRSWHRRRGNLRHRAAPVGRKSLCL